MPIGIGLYAVLAFFTGGIQMQHKKALALILTALLVLTALFVPTRQALAAEKSP